MTQEIVKLINFLDSIAWGPTMIVLLVGTGLYLTISLGLIQLRKIGLSIDLIRGKYDNPDDEGDITHFQALSAALSATIGVGNIAGVATAIASGGPGAVFWMWVTALVGMATKYSSCLLALKYRHVHEDGSVSGGPMYFIENGLGQKWLAWSFAFFAMIASLGIGNMTQANSVADAFKKTLVHYKLDPKIFLSIHLGPITEVDLIRLVIGITLAVLVALVIIGGIRRIAKVASRIVPFMCIVYVIGALGIIGYHIGEVFDAFRLIFHHAFTPTAAAGGFIGAAVQTTIRYGVARGVFSNESGLGSAPIAHAAAKTKEPAREGLVAMIGPFIDTIIVCSMTALVIIISGLWISKDPNTGSQLTGAPLSAEAFDSGIPVFGRLIVTFGLMFFSFSTCISWSYYGDRCAEYIFGRRAVIPYRWLFVVCIPIGATIPLKLVWHLADALNGFMAVPNLIGVIGLSAVVFAETKNYFSREHIRH